MNFKIESIFPTNFLVSNIERSLSEELKLITSIKDSKETRKNEGNIISLETYLFDKCPELKSVRDFCMEGVVNFVNKCLQTPQEVEFYITQSWLNYTDTGQFHHKHTHPNSIVSGVFYFKADPSVDKINFYKPHKEHQFIELPVQGYDWLNSYSWYYPVKDGDLIVFPSGLTHDVSVTTGDKSRISLAFNTFIRGSVGSIQGADALHLR